MAKRGQVLKIETTQAGFTLEDLRQQEASENPVLEIQSPVLPPAGPLSSESPAGRPPAFCKALVLEACSIDEVVEILNREGCSLNRKKLAILDYLHGFSQEILYVEVADAKHFIGVLGYGNPALVSDIRDKLIPAESFGAILDGLENKSFLETDPSSLPAALLEQWDQLAFSAGAKVFVFPVFQQGGLIGLWMASLSAETAQSHDLIPTGEELTRLSGALKQFQFT